MATDPFRYVQGAYPEWKRGQGGWAVTTCKPCKGEPAVVTLIIKLNGEDHAALILTPAMARNLAVELLEYANRGELK